MVSFENYLALFCGRFIASLEYVELGLGLAACTVITQVALELTD